MKKSNKSAEAVQPSAIEEIEVLKVTEARVTFCLLGRTPLICNRVSEKAKRQLFMPQKRSKAELASTLKHQPFEEFRESAHTILDPKSETLLGLPSVSFKRALASVAVDMPGSTSKAQIGRLSWVEGELVPVFGEPKILLSVVKNLGMNRTPDIRSRVIVPRWACRITVRYVTPILREAPVATLLAAAGMMNGIGDWRQQKGGGNYGQWELVEEDHKDFVAICKEGRAVQEKAMRDPSCYDQDTAEMLAWFTTEAKARGFKEVG